MNDQSLAPLRAAKPKTVDADVAAVANEHRTGVSASLSGDPTLTARRGPGRPPKPEPLDAVHAIGAQLKPFDRDTRIKILETLLDLT